MALIVCTECGKEFSARAIACPNCGCPTSEVLKDYEEENKKRREENERNNKEVKKELIKMADNIDELLNEYKFLTSDEIQCHFDLDYNSKENDFFYWYVHHEDEYENEEDIEEVDKEFNKDQLLCKRRKEIIEVSGYFTLKSIKNDYVDLSSEKIREIRNSIPLRESDDRLEEITVIDFLINIANNNVPRYIFDNWRYYINKENPIEYLGTYSDLTESFYKIDTLSPFVDTYYVSKSFVNKYNINNVNYPNNIKSGQIISVIDLFVLSVKGELPHKVRFLDNEEMDENYVINQDFNYKKDSIEQIFDDEYFIYDEVHLNDKIMILE